MSALPISLLLEEGVRSRRHRIPYMTFRQHCHPAPISDRAAPPSPSDKSIAPYPDSENIGLVVDDPFFLHLLSGETRLPSHPLVRGYAAADEEYETYVGEDDWKASNPNTTEEKPNMEEDEDDEQQPPLPPVPAFHTAINWITSALEYLSSVEPDHHPHLSTPPAPQSIDTSPSGDISIPCYRGAGSYEVVLAGKYSVADDCPWAVSSRCAALRCTKDVVIVMQSSTKFAMDLQRQRREVLEGKSASLEFSLIRCMGRGGADEWRVFIPYRLGRASAPPATAATSDESTAGDGPVNPKYLVTLQDKGSETNKNIATPRENRREAVVEGHNGGDTPEVKQHSLPSRVVLVPELQYTAVSQRATDVCYPGIVAWGEKEHHEHHQLLVKRVLQADFLNRFNAAGPGFPAVGPTSASTSPSAAGAGSTPLEELLDALLADMNAKYQQQQTPSPREPSRDATEGTKTASSETGKRDGSAEGHPSEPFFSLRNVLLVLAVDVIWSSATLPVYLLSGQVHLFAARPPAAEGHETTDELRRSPPWIWTLEDDEDDHNGGAAKAQQENKMRAEENADEQKKSNRLHTDGDSLSASTAAPTVAQDSTSNTVAAAERRKARSGAGISTLTVEDNALGGGAGFWRLLRSSYHWNQYVKNVSEKIHTQRLRIGEEKDHANDGSDPQAKRQQPVEKESIDTSRQRENNTSGAAQTLYRLFCIIASEADDLLTASERKDPCRSGLPLELLQPELLEGNEEAMAFFQRWREQLEEEKRRSKGGDE